MRAINILGPVAGFGLLTPIFAAPVATANGAGDHPNPRWQDYQTIIEQDQTPARHAGLAQLGVTAGRIVGTRGPLDVVVAPVQLSQLVIKGPARARLVRMQYISLRQSGGQSRPRSIGYLEAVTPLFDEHSRLLPPPPLADSTGPSGPLSFLPALSSRAYLPIQYFSPGFDRR